MLSRNIRKYRLLNGLSLRDMATKLSVSHQTIKKYEDGTLTPNSTRLIEIAKILNVNISDLVYSYKVPELKFENFRMSSLSKKKRDGLFMLITDEIGKYMEILDLSNEDFHFNKSKWTFDISSLDDIDDISIKVRNLLGLSDEYPLDNFISRLEDNNFLILEIDFEESFDGFCEYVNDYAFIILSSKGHERNRFTLAHELGHLILNFKEDLDSNTKEKYCHYFASCLLMPTKSMNNTFIFGNNISKVNISLNEILLLATEYKVSLQSVIMRLNDLKLIDESKKRSLFIEISKYGWRKEQINFVDEHPLRKNKLIFRLESEGIINLDETVKYLGVTINEYFRTDLSNRC